MVTKTGHTDRTFAAAIKASSAVRLFVFANFVLAFVPGIAALIVSRYGPVMLPFGLTEHLFPYSILPAEGLIISWFERLEGKPSGSFAGNLLAEQLTVISLGVMIVSMLTMVIQIHMKALWPYQNSYYYENNYDDWKKRLRAKILVIPMVVIMRAYSILMLLNNWSDIERNMTNNIKANHYQILLYVLAPGYLMFFSYVEAALVASLYALWKFRPHRFGHPLR
jgi:hypothetical protein